MKKEKTPFVSKRPVIHNENLSEIGQGGKPSILSMDQETDPVVEEYQAPSLRSPNEGTYQATKMKYGSLSSTDNENRVRQQKDLRFMINPLLRNPLSIEEQERKVIEERVKSKIQALTDEAKAEGSVVGYRDGLAKGHEEAFLKFKEESKDRAQRFESLLSDLETARNSIFQANQELLIDLIFRVSRLVLLRELQTDREYLVRLTKELIEKIGVRENIKIRLNPKDFETAKMFKENLEASLGQMKNLCIEVSPETTLGGCQVETEFNAIDASIDSQIKNIFDGLVAGHSSQTPQTS